VVAVVVFAVLSFLAGLVVLGLLGWKVFGRVRSLGRTVGAASTRIADASAELETIAPRER
jgi:UPF0716 family protein affecting phage T7 exclusion